MKWVICVVFLLAATAAKSQKYIKFPCIDCDQKQTDKILSDVSTITGFEKKGTSVNTSTEQMFITFVSSVGDSIVATFRGSSRYHIEQFVGPFSSLLKLDKEMFGREVSITGEKADYWNVIYPNGQNGFVHLIPSTKQRGKWVLKLE